MTVSLARANDELKAAASLRPKLIRKLRKRYAAKTVDCDSKRDDRNDA